MSQAYQNFAAKIFKSALYNRSGGFSPSGMAFGTRIAASGQAERDQFKDTLAKIQSGQLSRKRPGQTLTSVRNGQPARSPDTSPVLKSRIIR